MCTACACVNLNFNSTSGSITGTVFSSSLCNRLSENNKSCGYNFYLLCRNVYTGVAMLSFFTYSLYQNRIAKMGKLTTKCTICGNIFKAIKLVSNHCFNLQTWSCAENE